MKIFSSNCWNSLERRRMKWADNGGVTHTLDKISLCISFLWKYRNVMSVSGRRRWHMDTLVSYVNFKKWDARESISGQRKKKKLLLMKVTVTVRWIILMSSNCALQINDSVEFCSGGMYKKKVGKRWIDNSWGKTGFILFNSVCVTLTTGD